MDEALEVAVLIGEARRLRDAIDFHRTAISTIGTERRGVVADLVARLGPSKTARELGMARQTLHEILNPAVPRERKAKLRRAGSSARSSGP